MGNIVTKGDKTVVRKAKKHFDLGQKANSKDCLQEALRHYEEAIRFQRQQKPDSVGLATILNRTGEIHWRLGNINAALEYFQDATRILTWKASGSDILAQSFNNIGCIHKERGQYQEAMLFLERARMIREKSGYSKGGLAIVYNNIAVVLKTDPPRHAEAIQFAEQALAIKEKVAPGSASLAISYLFFAQEFPLSCKGLAMCQKAVSIASHLQKPTLMIYCLAVMANISIEADQEEEALELLKRASVMEANVVSKKSLLYCSIQEEFAKALDKCGMPKEAEQARAEVVRIRQAKAPLSLKAN